MNKKSEKKGFTLIELLAVVLILGIIALIAVPVVSKVIKTARLNAFRVSAQNISKASENKCSVANLKPNQKFNLNVKIENKLETTEDKITDSFTGEVPDYGFVYVENKCNSAVALYNEKLKACAYKEYNDEKVMLIKNVKDKRRCNLKMLDPDYVDTSSTGYLCSDPTVTPTPENYFIFNQANGTITGYDSSGPKDVIIPCQIGGVNVTTIGASAFASKGLKTVMMPDTITSIGASAFESNSITKVDFSSNLLSIGNKAFYSNSLTEIVFPDTLRTIANGSYKNGCCGEERTWEGAFTRNNLTKITFGRDIETIGNYAFSAVTSRNWTGNDMDRYGSLTIVDFSHAENLRTIGERAFYRNYIGSINLENSKKLTSIGDRAFYGNSATQLILSGSNLNIAASAFQSMRLSSVEMEVGTVVINSSAFANNVLTEINIDGAITSEAVDAFKSNYMPDADAFRRGRNSDGSATSTLISYAGANRSNITIPNYITNLAASFDGLGLTGTLNTGNGVTSIGASKFASNSLTTLIVGTGVTSIGDSAFANNQIKNITFSEGLQSIGDNAFYNNKIEVLEFPNTLKTIANGSYKNGCCGEERTWEGAFVRNNLKRIKFGSGIETIGNYVFSAVTSRNYTGSDTDRYGYLTEIDFSTSTNLRTIGERAFYRNYITELDLTNCSSLTSIGDRAFYGNSLSELQIGGANLTISPLAFAGNALVSLSISSNTVAIKGQVFSNNLLNQINITASIVEEAVDTFKNNRMPDDQAFRYGRNSDGSATSTLISYAGANRSNITIPNDIKTLSASFDGLGLTGTLNTGNGVTAIADSKFASNSLTTLIIGTGVRSIGASAFANNQIKDITFSEGLQSIGHNAFYNNKIEVLEFPDTLKTIASGSYKNGCCGEERTWEGAFVRNNLKRIKFGTGIETIGNYVFSAVTSRNYTGNDTDRYGYLTQVDFSTSTNLITIGERAFYRNYIGVVNLSNCSSLTSIGDRAFYGNGMIEVSIGGNNLTINDLAFSNNSLSALNMNVNTVAIKPGSFANNVLTEINVTGAITSEAVDAFKNNQMPDDQAFRRGRNSDGSATSTLISYAGANRSNITIPNYITTLSASFDGLGLTGTLNTGNGVTSIGASKFASNSLTTLIIGTGVTSIGESAFANNQIKNITFSEGLQTIYHNAFYNNKIEVLQFPDTLKTIANGSYKDGCCGEERTWEGAFVRNNLQSVKFGSGIETIGNYVFSSVTSRNWTGGDTDYYGNLTQVDFSRATRLRTIGERAFYKIRATNINLENSIQLSSIGERAFYGGRATNVILSGTNLTIGKEAFSSNSIATLTLASTVTIGESAFYSNSLTYVEFPSNVMNVGANAFNSNSLLDLIFVRGKVDETNFRSTGSSWFASNTEVRYDLDSCYTYNNGEITDYNTICSKNIEIPSSLGGNPVTTIAADAFKDKSLTRVVLPSTVQTIGAGAFAGNTIEPIIIMGKANLDDFTSLGDNWDGGNTHQIFENDKRTCMKVNGTTLVGIYNNESICRNYKNVEMPRTVVTINASALYGKGLTGITVPSSVTEIGANAFANNILDYIKVEDGTRLSTLGSNWNGTTYKVDFLGDSYDYNCFTLSGTAITGYKRYCKADVDLTNDIQGVTITEIAANAFKNSAINSVHLSSNITTIGDSAFEDNDLTLVDLVSGLTSIGARAFYKTGLIDVSIPRTITSIGANAFASNSELATITVVGKSNLDDVTLGDNWSGTCTNIEFDY